MVIFYMERWASIWGLNGRASILRSPWRNTRSSAERLERTGRRSRWWKGSLRTRKPAICWRPDVPQRRSSCLSVGRRARASRRRERAALSDPRGNLIYEYLRLIDEVRPRYFVLENVANIVTAVFRHRPISGRPGKHWSLKRYSDPVFNGGSVLPPLEEDELDPAPSGKRSRRGGLRFDVVFGVLDAAQVGSPQKRLRFVMIGRRDGRAPDLPAPTHGHVHGRLHPYRTVRDAIADLEAYPGIIPSTLRGSAGCLTWCPKAGIGAICPPTCKDRPSATPTMREGARWGSTGAGLGLPFAHNHGTCQPEGKYLVLSLTNHAGVRQGVFSLQGFPDDWQFSGSMNVQYMQVGNAVPLALGEAVGRQIASHNGTGKPSGRDYEEMLSAAVHKLRSVARNQVPSPETLGKGGFDCDEFPKCGNARVRAGEEPHPQDQSAVAGKAPSRAGQLLREVLCVCQGRVVTGSQRRQD